MTLDLLPPASPDLNIIETVWGQLTKALGAERRTAAKAQAAVSDFWNKLPLGTIADLANDMHARCEAVLKAKGGPTRF